MKDGAVASFDNVEVEHVNSEVTAQLNTIPAEVLAKIRNHLVKQASIMKGKRLNATSKFHRFAPAVALEIAIGWLVDQNAKSSSLVFDNASMLMFVDGHYHDFDDADDE